jgi:hypothetical protein
VEIRLKSLLGQDGCIFMHGSQPQKWDPKVVNIKLAIKKWGLDYKINVSATSVEVMGNL